MTAPKKSVSILMTVALIMNFQRVIDLSSSISGFGDFLPVRIQPRTTHHRCNTFASRMSFKKKHTESYIHLVCFFVIVRSIDDTNGRVFYRKLSHTATLLYSSCTATNTQREKVKKKTTLAQCCIDSVAVSRCT